MITIVMSLVACQLLSKMGQFKVLGMFRVKGRKASKHIQIYFQLEERRRKEKHSYTDDYKVPDTGFEGCRFKDVSRQQPTPPSPLSLGGGLSV